MSGALLGYCRHPDVDTVHDAADATFGKVVLQDRGEADANGVAVQQLL